MAGIPVLPYFFFLKKIYHFTARFREIVFSNFFLGVDVQAPISHIHFSCIFIIKEFFSEQKQTRAAR